MGAGAGIRRGGVLCHFLNVLVIRRVLTGLGLCEEAESGLFLARLLLSLNLCDEGPHVIELATLSCGGEVRAERVELHQGSEEGERELADVGGGVRGVDPLQQRGG